MSDFIPNKGQQEAINAIDGPLLIFAGPGTGKTQTLVERAVHMIKDYGIKPENIMMATFTNKAAKELITRIANELTKNGITINLHEMYIGTFHALCQRILKDNLEYTDLNHNFQVLSPFDEQYLIYQNIEKFKAISNIGFMFSKKDDWVNAKGLCTVFERLSEELVNIGELEKDDDQRIVALGEMLKLYRELLKDEKGGKNMIDMAALQTECLDLLEKHPDILMKLQDQIQFLMIDEYQDTNYIQEQLILKLGTKYDEGGNIIRQNICVVGDDDQSLYRFRGATVRNILEFANNFHEIPCKVVILDTNYRSNSDIVDFYNKWMATPEGFEWKDFRRDKKIKAQRKTELNSPAVVKLATHGKSKTDNTEWNRATVNFIKRLLETGEISDYNQIAFLFNSVGSNNVKELANYLEAQGIHVYSPRSGQFFERKEIMEIIGCFMKMFPKYIERFKEKEKWLENRKSFGYRQYQCSDYDYYSDCLKMAEALISEPANKGLGDFIDKHAHSHRFLKHWETLDYAYSGLLYQIFEFSPFRDYLDVDMKSGIADQRPARNLALFSQLLVNYELLRGIKVLSGKVKDWGREIDVDTKYFFNDFLRLNAQNGIDEYEDDSEYAPTGCVSFLTIHQAKGMEFPVVFVGSLERDILNKKKGKDDKERDSVMEVISEKYYHRKPFEPVDKTEYYDYWRLYYTAFSRAQDLLILTCNEYQDNNNISPNPCFAGIYNNLLNIVDSDSASEFDINEFSFHDVKDVNLMATLSFTSHIAAYETCALQYKFFKELQFASVRQGSFIFGTLVHQTIEDINKRILQGEKDQVTRENIIEWLNLNYHSLTESEHSYLTKETLEQAQEQVMDYVTYYDGRWDDIRQAEVDVSLIQPDNDPNYNYIIEGRVDLIRGTAENEVELIDFKSEKKDKIDNNVKRKERYRKQLLLYAYLVEARNPEIKVTDVHLYCTPERNAPMIDFPNTKSDINETMEDFMITARKILDKDYSICSNDKQICNDCDFRYYCKRK